MTERTVRLRARAMRCLGGADPAAEGLFKQSHDQTQGQPEILREAKALAHFYRHCALVIGENFNCLHGAIRIGGLDHDRYGAADREGGAVGGTRDDDERFLVSWCVSISEPDLP